MKEARHPLIDPRIEPTPESFHISLDNTLRALPRQARRPLRIPIGRIVLAMLVVLLMLCVPASGSQPFGVGWFLQNRRAAPTNVTSADQWSVQSISYDGLLLSAELNDAVWDRDMLTLSVSYSLGGTSPDTLTINRDQLGMDGIRHDHIWTKQGIIPVGEWSNGQRVITYRLDGWMIGGFSTRGSEDWLPDGLGETLLSELDLSCFNPERYALLLDEEGLIVLTQTVYVNDYASEELLETGTLTARLSAPSIGEWRLAYENIMP